MNTTIGSCRPPLRTSPTLVFTAPSYRSWRTGSRVVHRVLGSVASLPAVRSQDGSDPPLRRSLHLTDAPEEHYVSTRVCTVLLAVVVLLRMLYERCAIYTN